MSSKKKIIYNELAYFVKHKPTPFFNTAYSFYPKHIHIIN